MGRRLHRAPPPSWSSSADPSPGEPCDGTAGRWPTTPPASASSQAASVSRAVRQTDSAVSAAIRAASASTASRSRFRAMAAAASRSRVRVAVASRASPLIALISSSQRARPPRPIRWSWRLPVRRGTAPGHRPWRAARRADPRPRRPSRPRPRAGRRRAAPSGGSPRRRRPAVARGPRARTVRPRAGGARRTDRSRSGRRPVAAGADGADGAEEAASSALPVGASRSAVVVCRALGGGRAHRRDARRAVRVGSAPPEIGRGRRAGSGAGRPSPTPSVIDGVGRGARSEQVFDVP